MQALPVTVRAAAGSLLTDDHTPVPYAEAWLAVRPGIGTHDAEARSTLQLGVGLGAGVRMRGPGATRVFAGLGLEVRPVRESYAIDGGDVDDGLFALPIVAGVEVPLVW